MKYLSIQIGFSPFCWAFYYGGWNESKWKQFHLRIGPIFMSFHNTYWPNQGAHGGLEGRRRSLKENPQ